VVLRMKLGRLGRMVRRMLVMPMRCMRMMAGAFVIACLMPLGRVAMMSRGVFVVLGCLDMVLGCFS
jgi:hypothetical protein